MVILKVIAIGMAVVACVTAGTLLMCGILNVLQNKDKK